MLKKHLIGERKKGKPCYIKGSKLVINNDEFSIEKLQELQKEYTKSSSTPATLIEDLIEHPETSVSRLKFNSLECRRRIRKLSTRG